MSGTQYFLKPLKADWEVNKGAAAPEQQINKLEIPKPIKTALDPEPVVHHDIVMRIVKYIYHNQDFSSVKNEITEENIG